MGLHAKFCHRTFRRFEDRKHTCFRPLLQAPGSGVIGQWVQVGWSKYRSHTMGRAMDDQVDRGRSSC